jgi:hypothetical protein
MNFLGVVAKGARRFGEHVVGEVKYNEGELYFTHLMHACCLVRHNTDDVTI